MFIRLCWFFLFQFALTALAQQMITISGIVVDAQSQEPLPYAQISVTVGNIGTVSNEDGRFSLEIPDMFANDTLAVAYLGYATGKYSIAGIRSAPEVKFLLKPVQLQLAEVEIVAYTPEEVIRQVVAHIPENYGVDSVILTAFVRSQKYTGNKLAEFTEAIIANLKTGYSLYPEKEAEKRHRSSNVPDLIRGRVISDTILVNVMGEIGRSAGCLGCNFTHDFVEFYHNTILDEKLFRYYSFAMEELISAGGKIFHIWFDQRKGVKKTLWKGELFVNAADFALLKITQRPSFEAYETYEKDKFRKTYLLDNKPGWYKEMPRMEWTTTYSKRENFYYLNSIRVENWLTFINPATNRILKFSHKNEVVVTDATRDTNVIRRFRGDKSTGVNQRWDQLISKGDQEFWKNFNYLPVEGKLEENLKKMGK